ncbi:MAG: transglycosylase domain-containing protein [Defluviitaleaceae bacterium]|nr:transglycosylase domain-containing protein [Defluviitaleaceae bacterium]
MNYSKENNNKRMKKYKTHGKKVANKAGFLVLRGIVAFVLIGIFAAAGAGLGLYFSVIQGAPDVSTLPRGIMGGSLDSVILDRHGNEIVVLDAGVNRTWAEWDEIPQYLKDAFVAIEDERFFEHNGVDARGMVRAVYQTLVRGNQQGASTITQQLVKNMLGVTRNTIETKLQEQVMAVQFEAMLVEELGSVEAAKQHILHEYMNIIYLGGGNNGVQAAARFYFGKDVSELTLSEAAVIAGITQFPWRYNPARFPENNRYRKVNVLDSMLRLGFITEQQHYEAYHDDVYDRIQAVREQVDPNEHIWGFFTEAVLAQLEGDLVAMGMTVGQAQHRIFHDGLRIYTTMDPRIQEIVDREFTNETNFPTNPADFEYHVLLQVSVRDTITGQVRHAQRTQAHFGQRITGRHMFDEFIDWARSDMIGMHEEQVGQYLFTFLPMPQSSMVIIDHNNGHVVAMAGQRGEKMSNRAFNRATDSQRQPGSVFKIFASYAPAFDLGMITAATTFDDSPNLIWDYGLQRHRVWPNNWWIATRPNFNGYTTVRRAIEQSYNIVAVKNWNYVGAQTAYNYLLNFGFTTLCPINDARNPAVALGGVHHGITNLEITAAMGAIANGGILHQPILYTLVLDRNGDILIDNRNLESTQVISREAAYLLTNIMRGVMSSAGTAWSARLRNTNMDFMGKTGTTQEGRDVYFSGSTPYYTASVWVGHDERRTLSWAVTGSRPDTRLWQTVMEQVHQGYEVRHFERPAGFETRQVCADSGGIATWACLNDPRGSRVRTEIFAPGTFPIAHCHVHVAVEVEIITGLLPDPIWTPADQIELRSFITRDRFWAEIAGNVHIVDAWLEAPTAISTFFNPSYNNEYDFDHSPPEYYDQDPLYGFWGMPDEYSETSEPFVPDNQEIPETPPQTTLPFTLPDNTDRPPIIWP